MTKTVLLLNGPNLNLLGTREPDIYGKTTLSEVEQKVIAFFKENQIECHAFQSNEEGGMIDWLHTHRDADFLLMNPAGFTHTSIALRDAILGIQIPMIEIHISNIFKREPFRHHSYFSDIAIGSLVGLGIQGYQLAAQASLDHLK